MKKQLYLYLFILSALINVFTYMYFSKKATSDQTRMEHSSKIKKDSITLLTNKLYDANSFSLENNDNAIGYFQNYDVQKLIPMVQEALMSYNDNHTGNKFVDQPMMGSQKFIITKIKLLNHRWIIADYSNGELWGQVLLKYFVEDEKTVTFQTVDTYLFPKQKIE